MVNSSSSARGWNLTCIEVNGTNCWIYSPAAERGGCFVIDPGADGGVIINELEKRKVYPRHILLTHGHFDHIGALPELSEYYASQDLHPEIAIHEADAGYLGKGSLWAHQLCWSVAGGDSEYIVENWKPMPAPSLFLKEGDCIGALRVLHLPGHTPGSVGFFDEAARVLFSGDCLFKDGYGRTDLPGGDKEQMDESLNRLFALGDDVAVYSGHNSNTTIGTERVAWQRR
jgi:glyoxylase-like metal-dependent hydrolase (beta-lactamase superfamily II)